MEGFHSRKLSLELQDLDALAFPQFDDSPSREQPQEVSVYL